jgi:bacteriocin-like protein
MPTKPKSTGTKKPAAKGKPTKSPKTLTDKDLEVVSGGSKGAPPPRNKKPWVW